jgi:hypothetical protein
MRAPRSIVNQNSEESDRSRSPAFVFPTIFVPILFFAYVLLAAILAKAINLECVARGEVMMGAADLLLELADLLAEKFNRTSTPRADHVVVAAPVVLMLVARNAVVKGNFAGQPALGEKFQRAINGGVTDARVFFLDEAMKFIGRQMIAGFKKSSENRVTLASLFETDTLQMCMQNSLGLADHLA